MEVYSTNHVQIRCEQLKTPKNSKCYANKLRNVFFLLLFLFWGFTLNREPQMPNFETVISLHHQLS